MLVKFKTPDDKELLALDMEPAAIPEIGHMVMFRGDQGGLNYWRVTDRSHYLQLSDEGKPPAVHIQRVTLRAIADVSEPQPERQEPGTLPLQGQDEHH